MLRWLGALCAALVLSFFAVLLVTGNYYNEGPVLFTVSASHGVHRGDVGIVAAWALGILALACSAMAGRGRG